MRSKTRFLTGFLAASALGSVALMGTPAYADGVPADTTNEAVVKMLQDLQAQLKAQGKVISAQSAKINQLEGGSVSTSSGNNEDISDVISEYIEEHEDNLHTSKLNVGGWADFVYQDRDSDGYNQVFDPQHLYLFFDAKLDDAWRVYSELEIEHLPELTGTSGTGEIKVERMYIEHSHSDALNARIGKFNTPLGIWTPEHWAVNVPSVQKPIHEDNKYVPNKQVGLEGFGTWASSSESDWAPEVTYSLWTSTGGDVFGTGNPTDDKFAYGADVSAVFGEKIKLGLTGYTQNNAGKNNRRERTLFPYAELYLPQNITITGEYLSQSRDKGFSDIDTWYASAKWQFKPNTYLYYRRDQGDDVKRGAGDTHTTNVFTLGYWPKAYVRTKLEFSNHDFDSSSVKNYDQWNAWIGIIF